MAAPLDVVGIGNALVDVLSSEEDDFLVGHGLVKGSMALVDATRSELLYASMGPAIELSGGSAANTMAGLASLGSTGGFIGRVRNDQLGAVFVHDMRAVGVDYTVAPATDGPPTGRCLVVVTPDAQRTMSTYLGAASELGPSDVDEDLVGRAAITYLEGYLFDREPAKEAFEKAAAVAHREGGKVALTLSDQFCVARYRTEFLDLVAGTVDVLFANEDELVSLYEAGSADEALTEAEQRCAVVALTRGPRGCTVAAGGVRHDIPAAPVAHVVDTTGAGDLFAAGFLHGFTAGRDLATCGRLGTLAAGEVISHLGARPEIDLVDLTAAFG